MRRPLERRMATSNTPDDAFDAYDTFEVFDANEDAAMHALHLERARRLGRQLGVEVAIDTTGWLRDEIEIVISKARDNTVQPVMARIGSETSDDDVLANGVLVYFSEYNAALARLRQLAERLGELVHEGRVLLVQGSAIKYAHAELSQLEALIRRRQEVTLGNNAVLLATLRREIEFFSRYDAHLAPIIHAAERGPYLHTPRPPSRSHGRWRWLTWWRFRRTAVTKAAGHHESTRRETT